MSGSEIINAINASNADFLIVSLGAKKGQAWLRRNHDRLSTPVRSHLGAVINFQASTIKRAPAAMRKTGFEWLWRILQEPHLWRRYWNDFKVLVILMFTRVLPLVGLTWWTNLMRVRDEHPFSVSLMEDLRVCTVTILGPATRPHVQKITAVLREALKTQKSVVVDLSNAGNIDARVIGLFLMLRKQLIEKGKAVTLRCQSSKMRKILELNNVDFLIAEP